MSTMLFVRGIELQDVAIEENLSKKWLACCCVGGRHLMDVFSPRQNCFPERGLPVVGNICRFDVAVSAVELKANPCNPIRKLG